MRTLTTGEIAKLCDVHLRTVIRWIERGDLKGFKLPGRGNNRVRAEDFIDFLNHHGMPVPQEFETKRSNLIMIVDDEPNITKAIQRVLRGAGYETSIATDSFSAGSKCISEKPALMTLDLSMPGIDGFQVLKFVRESEELSHTKILVISALDEEKLQEAVTKGADAFLQKPFANDDLLKAVELLIG
ncbi:response regulator [Neptunomonas antarctica]|uniref:DNA binding domain-containing protein, excisionase family n=1 Tax=Neptunomonas antarctica TaxID=619304 RepID=A0A1N7NN98_9GAMM|nr:response regulator [Neptunomonas antarctica]SIS99816.1 DNA binding domain-containing protein, excisionase family [Neptunomonas antarctica]